MGLFLTYLGVLDFDVDAIGPNCVFSGWSFRDDAFLQLLLPIIVLIVNNGQFLLAKLFFTLRLPRYRVLKLLNMAPSNKEELSNLRHGLNMKVISFIDCVYMTLVRYCVAAFVCTEVAPGKYALDLYPPMDCWTPEHRPVVVAASIALLVYVAGYPLFVAITLARIHKSQRHSVPATLRKYGELYDKYEPHAFAYQLMSIVRRGGFGFLGVFGRSPQMQCFFAQILLTSQFVAQVPPDVGTPTIRRRMPCLKGCVHDADGCHR